MEQNQLVESNPSSIFPANEQPSKNLQHYSIPALWAVVFLVAVFFLLKYFIYISDKDKEGK